MEIIGLWVYMFAIFAILTQLAVNLNALELGDPCEIPTQGSTPTPTEEPCNATEWLTCTQGVCSCQQGMFADRNNKCLVLIGSPCKEPQECVENAVCATGDDSNKPSICLCQAQHIPLPGNKACRLGPGAPCFSSEECSLNALLDCTNGRCVCDRGQDSQQWDPTSLKCVSLVGGQCNDDHAAFIKRPCTENAKCNKKKMCECEGGYKMTSQKTCLLDYGQNCTESEECHDYYLCVGAEPTSQNCGCDSTESVYDEKHDVCSVLAGRPCSFFPGARNSMCVERAECSPRYQTCQCESGFVEMTNGQCAGGYRADCNIPSHCDEEKNLECVENKCDCLPDYTYNSEVKKCVGFAGTACLTDSDCYELAECKENVLNSTEKLCACKNGYSATPDGLCRASFGTFCLGPEKCNPYDFLHCDDPLERCVCKKENVMAYNNVTKKCAGLPGESCYLVEIDGRKLGCVENAECIRQPKSQSSAANADSHGKCRCKDGTDNIAKRCIKKTTSGSSAKTLGNKMLILSLFFITSTILL